MSHAVDVSLAIVLVLAAAVWIGGFVTIVVVSRVARRTLGPRDRVAFFRGLGRSYGIVGGLALALVLGTGAALVAGRPWTGVHTAAAVVAGALVATAGLGVAQARRMTTLRRRALAHPQEARLTDQVRREACGAGLLRALIGVLSLTLVVLGMLIAA